MTDNPAKPPRFPYVGALLCAACLGAAAWTWMRYSYAWDVCVEDLVIREDASPDVPLPYNEFPNRAMIGRYVLLQGSFVMVEDEHPSMLMCRRQLEVDLNTGWCGVWVFLGRETPPARKLTGPGTYKGRVGETMSTMSEWWAIKDFDRPFVTGIWPGGLAVCVAASRFTGASIAGLVVAAMGVFVFSVAFRHWLGEWRKFREEARAQPPH